MLAVTGGFRITVGGLRISARSPWLVTVLAIINFTIWFSQARRSTSIASDLQSIWDALATDSRFVVAIALIAGAIATTFATRSAVGADASGYVSEAVAWTESFPPMHVEIIAEELPVETDPWLMTPLGWRPADSGDVNVRGLQVPTYAPGLPMLMAMPHAIAGINGAVSVVIASALIAVIATGLIATRFGGNIAGLMAAALIAFTPAFIYQSIQPMSDVPVTAAWMLGFALLCRGGSSDLAAGIACAVAVLIRPNLAPLAIVPLCIAHRRIAFAMPVALAGVFLATLQTLLYGSPLRSGYGSTEELFALSNIIPNIGRYAGWWVATAPATLIGMFGAIRLRSNRVGRALAAFAVLVIAAYLIYAVFNDWSFLRFLLPAVAVAAIFSSVELATWIERCPVAIRAPLVFVVVLGITAHGIAMARSCDTFTLREQVQRVASVGEYVNANLPPTAVLITGEQSGSMRYYTHRSILRWEFAGPDTLSAVLPKLEHVNRPVYVVLDAWEEQPFRARLSPTVPLDWPPMLVAGTSRRTHIWRLTDREKFQRGERVNTIRLP